jgi:DNA processing protein
MTNIKNLNIVSSSLESWLRLALTNQVGPRTVLKLLEHFQSVDNILSQGTAVLEKFINKSIAGLIYSQASQSSVNQALNWQNEKPNRYILTLEDNRYPRQLLEITDPPIILFAEGNIGLLKSNKVAVVGTRHPSSQGVEHAVNFSRDIANNGFCVVSGVAAGIDRHAHLGALQGKASTIGVVGTGIDIQYPKGNLDVYGQILQSGLLLSEYPLGTQPTVHSFPRRNRIVAGLSLGVLVIESALDGGSLITANLALEMGREVMAIPGSIHNPVAKGCNKLIKSGAKLVENVNDIIEEIAPQLAATASIKEQVTQNTSDPVLQAMGFDAISIDKICANTQIAFSEMCSKLLEFELSGQIANCGGGYYQRVFKG